MASDASEATPSWGRCILQSAWHASARARTHTHAHAPAQDENPAQTIEPGGDVAVRLALERVQFVSKGGCEGTLEDAASFKATTSHAGSSLSSPRSMRSLGSRGACRLSLADGGILMCFAYVHMFYVHVNIHVHVHMFCMHALICTHLQARINEHRHARVYTRMS